MKKKFNFVDKELVEEIEMKKCLENELKRTKKWFQKMKLLQLSRQVIKKKIEKILFKNQIFL